ncbi:DUF4129 domain-containing protein [Virgibacillus kimchii]
MRNNHPILTYAYHFLSEMIILFLLVLPFFHHRFMWVPYGNYIVIVLIVCIIFSILAKFTVSYLWYILFAPFLFTVFYLWDYPLILTILFTGVFIWRYINIRREEAISRENNYILITLGLIALNSILIQDKRIMIYPLLLFVTVIFGYITSHLMVIHKSERKELDKKLSVYFLGLLAAGAGLLFLIFEGIRFIIVTAFQGILDIIGGIIAGFAQLFDFLEPQEMERMEEELQEGGENPAAEYWNEMEGQSFIEVITPYVLIAIALLFLSILIFWIWKNRHNRFKKVEKNDSVSYSSEEMAPQSSTSSFARWRNSFLKKPDHPVRKMVYQFERTASKHRRGRRQFETVEDWMERIGLAADFTIYERVRYGEADVSEKEVNQLKEQIRKMEKELKEREMDES